MGAASTARPFEQMKAGKKAGKKRKLGALFEGILCPCCFKPGTPFCGYGCKPEDSKQRLAGLRSLMKVRGVHAYVVPSEDAHSSEYVAEADQRRSFLTGFSGSAGVALVTEDAALLWTDSRYFLQAASQLSVEWTLMKQHEPGVLELHDWVAKHMSAPQIIGCDPSLIQVSKVKQWRGVWDPLGIHLQPIEENLIDQIWMGKPPRPAAKVVQLPLSVSGESVSSKFTRVREALTEQDASTLVLNALDQIAWLLNLRGSVIECNPVFFAYMVLTPDEAHVYLQPQGESEELREYLAAENVKLKAYSTFVKDLPIVVPKEGKVMMEQATCSFAMQSSLPDERIMLVEVSPVEAFKSRKNASEIAGLRSASIKDSTAIIRYFTWLREQITSGASHTEFDAASHLSKLRRQEEGCVGDSFPTISSSGANAAIVHYHASKEQCDKIDPGKMYLCDTGGQYTDGTTDITRTMHFGVASEEEKRCFTRVLQGHISLARATFPVGTTGLQLEMLARAPLWQDGLDFGHGTGHGIGAYLNVHEGPMGIGGGSVSGSTIRRNPRMIQRYLYGFDEGMFVSNEPGFYKAGEFGMRIGSDMVSAYADTRYGFGTRKWLKFEYLSMVPISKALITVDILQEDELQWLNSYHESVWDAISPRLSSAEDATVKAWLREATRPLVREDEAEPTAHVD